MSNFSSGKVNTKYGTIHIHNPGSFHTPENIQTLRRRRGKPALGKRVYSADAGDVRLQGPALRAFRQAELRSTPRKLRRKGKIQPILITGVGYRSYSVQRTLVENSDVPGRYADPDGSMHVEALAIDDNNNLSIIRKTKVRRALKAEGFIFGVSGEPWHSSFRLSG